jgi:hypothetical protein
MSFETIVHGIGILLFVGAAITLLLHLVIDVMGAIKKLQHVNDPPGLAALGIGDLLEKLPERYLAATIVLLVGLFLFDPTTFGNFTKAAFPPAPATAP